MGRFFEGPFAKKPESCSEHFVNLSRRLLPPPLLLLASVLQLLQSLPPPQERKASTTWTWQMVATRLATRIVMESKLLRFTTRVVLHFTLALQTQKQRLGLAAMSSLTKSGCSSPRFKLRLMPS